ncbi:hypothetical protein Z043_123749 [Scleropages formosus]|uniref:Fucolectin tachylectin-4 pentraxin-1 domain-containing protein n=3 Tax=Scleropages formosus TaxID=113540 RepID=A0A0P7WBD3_SCLFO|nr:hypothetical protein Z043_123749 [Scleropages formosus]
MASQSSLYDSLGDANNAIDGNKKAEYESGSCSHTQPDSKPWWRVDLLHVHHVYLVTITNRRDCCEERINGAEIRIGNSLVDNGNENPRCAVISSIPAGESKTFQCRGMKGRYINVVLPRHEYLTLCEVEVNARRVTEENVALNGKATQSSQFDSIGSADKAIDGNKDSVYEDGSCSRTEMQPKPWWRVDLLERYKVTTVTVTNRGDCCAERINGAEIRIGDSLVDNGNQNPRCAIISSIPAGGSSTFHCSGMKGRYVNVVLLRSEYLTLCEVEVNAVPALDEDVALNGKATQSSQYDSLGSADNAIDGNTNVVYGNASCSHTQFDLKPWWRVDLLNEYKVTTVTITNRGDCCAWRINGAEIRIGNSLEDNGNENPRCAVITSISPGGTSTFECHGMTGRYVSVVLPRPDFLSLCEVEVNASPDISGVPVLIGDLPANDKSQSNSTLSV